MLFSLLFTQLAFAQTSICDGVKFCAIYNGQNCVTIHSSLTGWAAIGTGSQMAGSDIFFVSENQIANLNGEGNRQPLFKASLENIQVITPPPAFAKLSKSFCLSPSQLSSFKSGQNFIYAQGTLPPTGSEPSLRFSRHTNYNTLKVDFNLAGNTTGSGKVQEPILKSDDYERIILVHGIVLFIAWLAAPAVGIFTARFLKDALGKYWYYVHAGLLGIVTVGGTFFAVIMMILYRTPSPGHFADETRLGIRYYNHR
jgi:hypothetical protein